MDILQVVAAYNPKQAGDSSLSLETEKTSEARGDDGGLDREPVGNPAPEDDFPSSSSLALHSKSTCTKCTTAATTTTRSLAEASSAMPTAAKATTSNAVSGTMSGRARESKYYAVLAVLAMIILASFLGN